MMRQDVNEPDVAAALDVVANNPYHGTQDHLDGAWQALQGDFARSLKHTNFLVTETNAQTLGWDSAGQFPPYDGQLRLDVYTDVSSAQHGRILALAFHSRRSGNLLERCSQPRSRTQSCLRRSHPHRSRTKKSWPELANMKIKNNVAILYSVDSSNAITFMPFERA